MTSHPIKVLVGVAAEHLPLVDTLRALGVDIGSVAAATMGRLLESAEARAVADGLDPTVRYLCIATADAEAMLRFLAKLGDALTETGYRKMGRVVVFGGPMDTSIAAFIDVAIVPIA